MRIATLVAVLALLCVTTAYADKVPEGKEWSWDLTGLRNVTEVEPNDTCPGQEIACGDVVDAYLTGTDVDYFTFYVTAGTMITVGTDAGVAPDAEDTKLYLYDADCTNQLAYNDDGGPGYYSLLTYEATVDGYVVAMAIPYSTSYEGNYVLFVTCEAAPEPPVNDLCDGAIVIERCTTGLIEGDLTAAHDNYTPGVYPESCTGFGATGHDVTYVMTLEAGDMVDMFYFGGYDESFYIVTDCADPENTCVVGADETVGTGETISWSVPASGVYYLIVDAYSATNNATFTIDYVIDCPVANDEMTWGKVKSMFE